MKTINCEYCGKLFEKEHNNSKYCSKFCSKRNTDIKKKLRQKKYHETLVFRTCENCGIRFRFHGMKKNCKKCVDLLRGDPNLYKKKGKKWQK